eukprot:634875-Prorocentrum_minimum.AAC.3
MRGGGHQKLGGHRRVGHHIGHLVGQLVGHLVGQIRLQEAVVLNGALGGLDPELLRAECLEGARGGGIGRVSVVAGFGRSGMHRLEDTL